MEFPNILYHGGPNKFESFSADYINTGQHSQDFGYGLYFTTDKESARFYADELSRRVTLREKFDSTVSSPSGVNDMLMDYIDNNYAQSVKRLVNGYIRDGIGNRDEWVEFLRRIDIPERYGYIYTVRISNPKYMPMDKYRQIQRQKRLSDVEMNSLLLSNGFNGIIYEMNTRKLSDRDFTGEYNVVIIDDSVIDIVKCEKVSFDYTMKLNLNESGMAKKPKIVRLNESQLKRVIRESVELILGHRQS